MRIQLFGSSLLAVAALVGCGGDDGHIKVPDAKVFKDAAIDAPHMCLTMPTLGSLSVGTAAAPAMGQHFYKDMTSGTAFWGALIAMDNTATPDLLYFIVDEPAGGYVTGVPYKFVTDPTATTAEAVSFLDADTDASRNTTQELWPQPGTPEASVTFSMIMKTATGKIFASINMTNYKEIDDAGALVAGGCASVLTKMDMYFQQNAAPPARLASPSDPTNTTVSPDGTFAPILVRNRAEAIELMKQEPLHLNAY